MTDSLSRKRKLVNSFIPCDYVTAFFYMNEQPHILHLEETKALLKSFMNIIFTITLTTKCHRGGKIMVQLRLKLRASRTLPAKLPSHLVSL